MIKNKRQFDKAKKRLESLKDALEVAIQQATSLPEAAAAHMVSAVQSQIADIEFEVDEFLALGHIKSIEISNPKDLGSALIKARNSRGISQKALASRISRDGERILEASIQQWEKNNYRNVTLGKIGRVVSALEVELSGTMHLASEPDDEIRSETIVIVDDLQKVRDSLVEYLKNEASIRNLHWEIISCSDPAEFEMLIEQKGVRPSVVITDLVMNNQDDAGVKVAEYSQRKVPTAEIVILTAFPDALEFKNVSNLRLPLSYEEKVTGSERSTGQRILERIIDLLRKKASNSSSPSNLESQAK